MLRDFEPVMHEGQTHHEEVKENCKDKLSEKLFFYAITAVTSPEHQGHDLRNKGQQCSHCRM